MKRILRGLRIAHEYTVSDMARRIGVSHAYISKIESGEKKPSDNIIEKYSKEFHISKRAIKMFSDEANSRKDINNQEILLMILKKICAMKK